MASSVGVIEHRNSLNKLCASLVEIEPCPLVLQQYLGDGLPEPSVGAVPLSGVWHSGHIRMPFNGYTSLVT